MSKRKKLFRQKAARDKRRAFVNEQNRKHGYKLESKPAAKPMAKATTARYVIRQGTTVSTKKPGMAMREHVTEVELTFPVVEGFECAENRLGFLYLGWVLLVARKDVRQYGA